MIQTEKSDNKFAGLEDAISDVGYWNWWTADFPEYIMLEFGGTQIWSAPKNPNFPPDGKIGITFRKLNSVSFITRNKYNKDIPEDWTELLHADKLKQPELIKGSFTFTNVNLINGILNEATKIETVFGYEPTKPEFKNCAITFGFLTHNYGCVIGCNWISVANFEGSLSLENLRERNAKWWEYWEEYWKRINSDTPMPKDYACDVTIPQGTEIILPNGTKMTLPKKPE